MLKALPTLAIATGVLLVLRTVVPRGALAGPLVLIVGGSLVLAAQLGWLTVGLWDTIGSMSLVAGGVVIAMSNRSRPDPVADIVSHHWSVFLPNAHKPRDAAPHKLIVRCLFGDFVLDLSGADFPGSVDRVTVDVTVLVGTVTLRVPRDWEVRAGRVDLTSGVRFTGDVDWDVYEVDDDSNDELGPPRMFLNVQGWASRVIVDRAHESDVSSRSPEPPGAS